HTSLSLSLNPLVPKKTLVFRSRERKRERESLAFLSEFLVRDKKINACTLGNTNAFPRFFSCVNPFSLLLFLSSPLLSLSLSLCMTRGKRSFQPFLPTHHH